MSVIQPSSQKLFQGLKLTARRKFIEVTESRVSRASASAILLLNPATSPLFCPTELGRASPTTTTSSRRIGAVEGKSYSFSTDTHFTHKSLRTNSSENHRQIQYTI